MSQLPPSTQGKAKSEHTNLASTKKTGVGPGRYAKRFAQLKAQGKHAFIPFTILGWPTREKSLEIIDAMLEGGATMLELGLAFSDPAADGPIIQQADVETLATGFKVKDALTLIKAVRQKDADIPIGLLVYYNMVLAKGPERFFQQLAEAGADGVLIADLPPELAEEVLPAAQKAGIDLIFIVSPLTSNERLEKIAAMAGGFLYVVSRLGITGTEARYDTHLKTLLARIKAITPLPACVGFGISTPEQATNMIQLGADGAITGSKVIQIIRDNPNQPINTVLAPYIRTMAEGVN
jgi:tryptophan synthase alpha chain